MLTYFQTQITFMSVKLNCVLNYDVTNIMQIHKTKNTPMVPDILFGPWLSLGFCVGFCCLSACPAGGVVVQERAGGRHTGCALLPQTGDTALPPGRSRRAEADFAQE